MEKSGIPMTLYWNGAFSVVSFFLTIRLIKGLKDMFLNANLYGIDMSKKTKYKVPEAQGVLCGAVFIIIMFLFIPIPFYQHLASRDVLKFPFAKYVEFLAALLSICCMIFLGFADDVLDLRWRHKLLLPTVASLPLLMVYFVTFDLSVIIVPQPLRPWFGYSVDIGVLYYIYMGMLAVFCTNAINIVAGINGIEAGQSLVIAVSVAVFNLIELSGDYREAHEFSLYFMMPFIGVSSALLTQNWYPSSVFVGDTFCYFSGMTFAVVAILGHFSKTMLLFMIPQVFNFLFSCPQLFRLVPCPRHRLPKYNPETDLMELSYSEFKENELSLPGWICIKLFSVFGLVHVRSRKLQGDDIIEVSNMTIINLAIRILGPTNEGKLTTVLLVLQAVCSLVALIIRYPLARLFYDQ